MKVIFRYNFFSIVTVFAVTMFFSCQGQLEDVKDINTAQRVPSGIAENFKLTYTDSGKVKAILTSSLNYDFSNQKFEFQEFPNGLYVEFFDDQNNKSTVTADYGIMYSQTSLVDLQGNVVLETYDGKKLEAPQLYWDQKNEWVFTEKEYTFTSDDLNMSGTGIDFNKEFSIVNSHENTGSAVVKE
ncbi:LPS export ABC transporter periplasmic protein LptC [Zhouia spongiae]|nr:LPS export ABC transporter periplasmic protein LptC [Zhouia spongiae]